MMKSNGIQAYLETYAEAIAQQFEPSQLLGLKPCYDHVLVIPAFDESADDLARVLPVTPTSTVLMILVVNAPVDGDRICVQRTQTCLEQLGAGPEIITILTADHPWCNQAQLPPSVTVLVVDCCRMGRELPAKQGVGLARKIGCDLALACIAAGIINNSWIHCSDSDVRLPHDYWQPANWPNRSRETASIAVALYPFTHRPSHESSLQYEISLRYYLLQLAQAGSPYDFHTIGSLLKISAHHYAAVRGFPKRQAAEDFYLLNKLAKTGAVLRLNTSPVILSSRRSHRVPFGTGAAMNRLAREPEWLFYHPAIFQALRKALALLPLLWRDRRLIQQMGGEQWCQQFPLESNLGSPWLWSTLQSLGFDQALRQALRQSKDFEHFQYFLWVWFDGFRTLKFVHALRDCHYPSLPLPEAITLVSDYFPQLTWNSDCSRLENLQRINKQLQAQELTLAQFTGPRVAPQ